MVIGVAARPRALLQWEVDYIGLDRYQETHGRVNRTHKLATREPIHTGGINLGYIAAQSLRKFRSLIGHQGIVSLLNSLQYYFPILSHPFLNFNSLWSFISSLSMKYLRRDVHIYHLSSVSPAKISSRRLSRAETFRSTRDLVGRKLIRAGRERERERERKREEERATGSDEASVSDVHSSFPCLLPSWLHFPRTLSIPWRSRE